MSRIPEKYPPLLDTMVQHVDREVYILPGYKEPYLVCMWDTPEEAAAHVDRIRESLLWDGTKG